MHSRSSEIYHEDRKSKPISKPKKTWEEYAIIIRGVTSLPYYQYDRHRKPDTDNPEYHSHWKPERFLSKRNRSEVCQCWYIDRGGRRPLLGTEWRALSSSGQRYCSNMNSIPIVQMNMDFNTTRHKKNPIWSNKCRKSWKRDLLNID